MSESLCIVCRKGKKRKGSFFCKYCVGKNIFVKIEKFRLSPEFRTGINSPKKWGKLDLGV